MPRLGANRITRDAKADMQGRTGRRLDEQEGTEQGYSDVYVLL